MSVFYDGNAKRQPKHIAQIMAFKRPLDSFRRQKLVFCLNLWCHHYFYIHVASLQLKYPIPDPDPEENVHRWTVHYVVY